MLIPAMIAKVKAQVARNKQRNKAEFDLYEFDGKVDPEYLYQMVDDDDVTQIDRSENKQKSTKKFDKVNSLAGVDVYFNFHTVARYIGLIQSKDVAYLREDKDHIIVNDDQ